MNYLMIALVLFLSCNSLIGCFPFVDLKYEQINEILSSLGGVYGQVSTATQLYNLPSAKDGSLSCSPYIARVTELDSLVKDYSRPQIVISGEIHGDERVGPLATLMTTQLLVLSSECVITKNSRSCDELQSTTNITSAQKHWLAFLATRRDTLLIPTANCLGYIKVLRNDAGVDPNRDFPYSRENNKCMMSTTARIFYHLMRRNLIQVVVTFHSGMVAIGYEWGSKNHMSPRDSSPDDNANKNIGELMVSFSGSFNKEKLYPVGRINSMVYPVDGGMEDWLYAGWDHSGMRKDCIGLSAADKAATQNTHNLRYRKSKPRRGLTVAANTESIATSNITRSTAATIPDNSDSSANVNRALVFLVETSDRKVIRDSTLGESSDILNSASPFNGHVPRNVRLGLLSIDLLQPYVCLSHVKMMTINQSLVARRTSENVTKSTNTIKEDINSNHSEDFSRETTVYSIDKNSAHLSLPHSVNSTGSSGTVSSVKSGIRMKWYVGGGTTVDSTFLAWHSIPTAAKTHRSNRQLKEGVKSSSSAHHRTWSGDSDAADVVDTSNWSAYLDLMLSAQTISVFDRSLNQTKSSTNSTVTPSKASFPVIASKPQSGMSRWKAPSSSAHSPSTGTVQPHDNDNSVSDASHSSHYAATDTMRPLSQYIATVDPVFDDAAATTFPPGRYWLVAWAVVDSSYGESGQGEPADSKPQSHYSNARSNPSWRYKMGGRAVIGRRYWPSDPVVVVVDAQGEMHVESETLHCAWWARTVYPAAAVKSASQQKDFNSESVTTDSIHGYRNIDVQSGRASSYNDSDQFLKIEQHYILALLIFFMSVICCIILMSNWRRSRIYSSLISNKYINVNSIASNSGLEKMKLLNLIKSPARGGGGSRQ